MSLDPSIFGAASVMEDDSWLGLLPEFIGTTIQGPACGQRIVAIDARTNRQMIIGNAENRLA